MGFGGEDSGENPLSPLHSQSRGAAPLTAMSYSKEHKHNNRGYDDDRKSVSCRLATVIVEKKVKKWNSVQ